MSSKKNTYFILFFVFLLFLLSIPIQKLIDDKRNRFRALDNILYFNSGTLKKISLGYEELIADIYWLRVLQYFGNTKLKDQDPDKLYKYFDILTDLDPKFVNAYRFGATFIGELPPYGLGDLESGLLLLDKGRKNNPYDYKLPLEQAFLYYLYTTDYSKAAELFEEASEKPDLGKVRRASMKGMAANARLKGGQRGMAKKIWKYIYETNQSEGRKNYALKNLKELDAMDIQDSLTDLYKKYYLEQNRYPKNINELVRSGYLKTLPIDYGGNNFIIAPKANKIKSITLTKNKLEENIAYLNAKVNKYKRDYDINPESMEVLRNYINKTALLRKFPEHPLGEDYIYDPETGVVDYDKSFLN